MLERLTLRISNSVLLWDVLLTLFCLYITTHMRILLPLGKPIYTEQVNLPLAVYAGVVGIWIMVFLVLIPQRALFTASLIEACSRLAVAILFAGLCFAGLLYLSPFRDMSRLQFFYFLSSNLVILLAFHLMVRGHFYSQRSQRWQRRVLIVSDSPLGAQIAHELLRRPWAGLQTVGYASDEALPDNTLPVLGSVQQTIALVQEHAIDEVVFALSPARQADTVTLSLQLQRLPVMVHAIPSLIDLTFLRTSIGTLGGIPLVSLRESVLPEPQRLTKRLFDLLVSTFLIIILFPVMACIAVLIKFDTPGPVVFTQERVGENGKPFKMLKFRSMYPDAEQRWREVINYDENGNIVYKTHQDPRITPFGQRLRRTSLDELPQLFNVLRGEMSLVGPRPEIPHIVDTYEAWQWQRFRIPPGITGWWQINGRSDKPMHLHTEDDLFYVQNYSFWLDIQILFKTIVVVWRGSGAY